MAQQMTSELTKKLMLLVEEKGKDLSWPKKEVLALLKKWQEEFTAEGEKLGEALSKKDGLGLTETTAIFAEFATWQTDRQQEVRKWEKELTSLTRKREMIEKELEMLITQHQGNSAAESKDKVRPVSAKVHPAAKKPKGEAGPRIAVSP